MAEKLPEKIAFKLQNSLTQLLRTPFDWQIYNEVGRLVLFCCSADNFT